jgi:hypothetical protein
MWWEFDVRQFYVTILTATIAGIVGLMRIIFTNKAEIQQLQKTLKHLEDGRERRDGELDDQLREIRHDVKNLLSRGRYGQDG